MSHALGVKCPTCGTQTVPEGCPEGCPLGHGSTFTDRHTPTTGATP